MAGRAGRPPKPIELKRLTGNPGQRRLPTGLTVIAPAVVESVGAPADGRALIAMLLDGPAAAWIAQPDRLGLLELLAQGWDERDRIRADIEANGYGEGRYARPVVARLDHLEKQITAWLSLLGLTPTDRSRLGVAEVKARSRLDDLRARRDSRSRAG